jgi:hypothetical protein
MKLLDKSQYKILAEPLKQVKFNISFALSVIEHEVTGKVYVDSYENPKTFYVVHPYGMSLLCGDYNNNEFKRSFKDYALNTNGVRSEFEWMQVYPNTWDKTLSDLFVNLLVKEANNIDKKETGIIELNTRVNFKFNKEKYLNFKQEILPLNCTIIQTDKDVFTKMKGSVIPSNFWDSAEEFLNKGMGFSLPYNNRIASTAYSAFVHKDKLEIGIETLDEFRGKGYAYYACSALIDYCIANGYEPDWACRLENTSSYKLALKLGFEPCEEFSYYRLSK